MRKGLLALGLTVALTAGAGGVAAAASWASDNGGRDMHDQMSSMDMGSMDMRSMAAMHTPEMDAMHARMLEQMPEDMRAACDEIHTQMTGMADCDPADHAAHHDN